MLESWQEVNLLDSGDPFADFAGEHDCGIENGDELGRYVAHEVQTPELHIIGIRQPREPFSGPLGEVDIQIRRPGPLSLVLSSYTAARWIVKVEPQTKIDHIIINGYEAQEVAIEVAGAPSGTELDPAPTITAVSYVEDGDNLGLGHIWPAETELSDTCEDFYPPGTCDLLGDTWQSNLQRQIDELSRLVRAGEALTDRPLSSFHGCYRLSRFELL